MTNDFGDDMSNPISSTSPPTDPQGAFEPVVVDVARDVLAQTLDHTFRSERMTLRYAAAPGLACEVLALHARLAAVERLTYAGSDGSEYDHVERCEGETTCPACWAADIRAAVRGEQSPSPCPRRSLRAGCDAQCPACQLDLRVPARDAERGEQA